MAGASLILAGIVLLLFACGAVTRACRWQAERRLDFAALEAIRGLVSGLGALALMQWGASA